MTSPTEQTPTDPPTKPPETTPASLVDRFNRWLAEKHVGLPHCPVSQDGNWALADHVVELRRYEKGSLYVGGPVYPMVMVVCKTCGYTMFFNAVLIGLLREGQ